MATSSCQPQSVAFSTTPCISDVESYTFPGCAKEDEDFGFDPAVMKIEPLHVLPIYSAPALDDIGFDPPTLKPPDLNISIPDSSPNLDNTLPSSWRGFLQDDTVSPVIGQSVVGGTPYEIDNLTVQAPPTISTAHSRSGPISPPESNPASSPTINNNSKGLHYKYMRPKKRRRSLVKSEHAGSDLASASQSSTSGRMRKSIRKTSSKTPDSSGRTDPPEDNKRARLLEMNRLAAAKCRINKKQKVEQLKQDSCDKAIQNTCLKDQVMHMKEEVQQIKALLYNHVNFGLCGSPEGIRETLDPPPRFAIDQLNPLTL
jgi:hypothetical protein